MKLRQINENESIELAKDYIDDAKAGPLYGVRFAVYDDRVVITQDDSEDNDNDLDEYHVIKAEVPIGIWNQFMNVVNANDSESGPNT